jgi:uncharacterized membrane protein YagU involved in acid resistance
MKDRFTRGFVAGIIAGIPTLVFNMGAFYLKFATLHWADFMGIFTYGRKPIAFAETLFAIIAVYIFLSFLGIIFAYFILRMSSQNYILKGWVFGLSIWFISYAITILFNVPELAFIPLKTVLSNFIGASIWGISLALALKWLDDRIKVST